MKNWAVEGAMQHHHKYLVSRHYMYAAGRKKNLFSFQLEIGHKRHVSIISNSETLNMNVDWVGHLLHSGIELFLLRKMLGVTFGPLCLSPRNYT